MLRSSMLYDQWCADVYIPVHSMIRHLNSYGLSYAHFAISTSKLPCNLWLLGANKMLSQAGSVNLVREVCSGLSSASDSRHPLLSCIYYWLAVHTSCFTQNSLLCTYFHHARKPRALSSIHLGAVANAPLALVWGYWFDGPMDRSELTRPWR